MDPTQLHWAFTDTFQNLPKNESITEDYVRKKVLNKNIEINKIFISDDSLFNIS